MLERGLLSHILFPAPVPSYSATSFPQELVWVPKVPRGESPRSSSSSAPPHGEEAVPCLLLTYPSARFLIIFFHSNAEDLGRCRGFCCYLREQFQVHVLAVEYPGYGVCQGIPTGDTVMENAFAALRFALDTLKWPLDSIKVFGRSIGTGPAVALASNFRFAGVILVTPFLSVQELFRDRVGPLARLVEEWFSNKEGVLKITSPTMIIHGQRDELISCRHGQALYQLLRSRKLLVSPPSMEHNTNLLINLQFFVLPMFQFFSLPDYVFQDMTVPSWAYSRRCPSLPFGELAEAPDRPKAAPEPQKSSVEALTIPSMPAKTRCFRALPAGSPVRSNTKHSDPSSPESERYESGPFSVIDQNEVPRVKLVPFFNRDNIRRRDEGETEVQDEIEQPSKDEKEEPSKDTTLLDHLEGSKADLVSSTDAAGPRAVEGSEEQDAIRRLSELAGSMCVGEICSDGLVQESDAGENVSELTSRSNQAEKIAWRARKAQMAARAVPPASQGVTPFQPQGRNLPIAEPAAGWPTVSELPLEHVSLMPHEAIVATKQGGRGGIEDCVWARWCGTGRSALAIDLHEAGEDLHPQRPPRTGFRSPHGRRPLLAPAHALPAMDPPKALCGSASWCRGVPPHLVPFCCNGQPADLSTDLVSPKPTCGSVDEELLEHVSPALDRRRHRCFISI